MNNLTATELRRRQKDFQNSPTAKGVAAAVNKCVNEMLDPVIKQANKLMIGDE